ncbi:MAG TPA: LUD domain-containing protein [Nitrososphaerales archaeon]|nr:LUD domain-containing protein [Nitrososphaerales archaeon]
MTAIEAMQIKTQFGLPIDESFARPASEESIQKAAAALKAHNFAVEVVDTLSQARAYVLSILPKDQTIATASSETLALSGLGDDIDKSGNYKALRPQLEKLDRSTQRAEMRKLISSADVVVGSVHAITEDGRAVAASASGSQLGLYASAAGKVIWVVGSQKVVPDLDTAMRRVQYYAYPREDIRAREKYGMPSAVLKVLTVNGDWPGRITVVLVRETVGY